MRGWCLNRLTKGPHMRGTVCMMIFVFLNEDQGTSLRFINYFDVIVFFMRTKGPQLKICIVAFEDQETSCATGIVYYKGILFASLFEFFYFKYYLLIFFYDILMKNNDGRKYMVIFLVILCALILSFAVFLIILNNNLVIARNKVQESFSSIDVYLKMRFDLIPNLVECVRAYAKYEQQALTEVIKIRVSMQGAKSEEERIDVSNDGIPVIRGVFALAEKYPNLKADKNFQKLQKTLEEIEESLSATRRFYNTNVTTYNNKVKVFPNNLFAKTLGHKPLQFFKIKLGEEVIPAVFGLDITQKAKRNKKVQKQDKKVFKQEKQNKKEIGTEEKIRKIKKIEKIKNAKKPKITKENKVKAEKLSKKIKTDKSK